MSIPGKSGSYDPCKNYLCAKEFDVNKFRQIFLLVCCMTASIGATADHHVPVLLNIEDLQWMSGIWAGPVGAATLEENWAQPHNDSMVAVVRIMAEGKTSMVELIVIEPENNSLVLRLQQWDPGFSPRTPKPQTMKLKSHSHNRVTFVGTQTEGLKELTYSRPDWNQFNIDIVPAEGPGFQVKLLAQ